MDKESHNNGSYVQFKRNGYYDRGYQKGYYNSYTNGYAKKNGYHNGYNNGYSNGYGSGYNNNSYEHNARYSNYKDYRHGPKQYNKPYYNKFSKGKQWHNSRPSYDAERKSQYGFTEDSRNHKSDYVEQTVDAFSSKPKNCAMIEFTKEDQIKENELMKKVMVIATYKAYFMELSNVMTQNENSNIFNVKSGDGTLEKAQVQNTVFTLIKEMIPSRLVSEEIDSLLNGCMEECSTYNTQSDHQDIKNQIQHYSSEFNCAKEELLNIIVRRETAEHQKSNGHNDFEAKLKYMTPFRIYRKTLAPKIKELKPNLNGKERQAIIKDKWAQLSQKEKFIYVLRSRWDRERAIFKQKTIDLKIRLAFISKQLEKEKTLSTESSLHIKDYWNGKHLISFISS